MLQQGREADFQQVLQDLTERDNRDSSRDVSPLTVPKNAVVIDTSDLTIEEVTNVLLKHVRARLENK